MSNEALAITLPQRKSLHQPIRECHNCVTIYRIIQIYLEKDDEIFTLYDPHLCLLQLCVIFINRLTDEDAVNFWDSNVVTEYYGCFVIDSHECCTTVCHSHRLESQPVTLNDVTSRFAEIGKFVQKLIKSSQSSISLQD